MQTHVNNEVSETSLTFSNFTLNNPRYVLATGDSKRSAPIYLHCEVSARVNDHIKNDLLTKKKFYLISPKDVDRDSVPHYSDDIVRQMYDAQTKKFNKQNGINHSGFENKSSVFKIAHPSSINEVKANENDNDTNDDYDDDDYEEKDSQHRGVLRTKRAATDLFSYEWLKNDNSILTFSHSIHAQPVLKDGYTLYPNGTIQFLPSDSTAGVYRCKVTFTYLDQQTKKGSKGSTRNFDIGPIVSHATTVEIGNYFKKC